MPGVGCRCDAGYYALDCNLEDDNERLTGAVPGFFLAAACLLFCEAAFFCPDDFLVAFLFLPLVNPCRLRYKRMQIGSEKTFEGAHQGLAMTIQRSTQSCPQWQTFLDFDELCGS